MTIRILDSWLRDFLTTKASPQAIAEKLSLTSVSIERVEKHGSDFLYEIEITTNRPDLASVVGLAREAAAVLQQFGIAAEYKPPKLTKPQIAGEERVSLTIKNDPKLVGRVTAVIMNVKVQETPNFIKERLEAAGIRSLNNLIDVTNYVMRTIGHPTHVFDYDRLQSESLTIRESKKGEKITTLDKKEFMLSGGDIVAVNTKGEIVDLLGIMGLANSVVNDTTKRILYFIDNNDPHRMRQTSMLLGIRSEAVQLNEKGIDPQLAYDALLYGVALFEQVADGKIASDIIDIYPKKPRKKVVLVSQEKINSIIGVDVPAKKILQILSGLGFITKQKNNEFEVHVPSARVNDVEIPEDIIEEIARIYGYHNLPSVLPPIDTASPTHIGTSMFAWEKRAKHALKYWGFTEVYTYSSVSETMFEGDVKEAITLQNPLDEDHVYMRKTLVPSLLQVISQNKAFSDVKIFELANIYEKNNAHLPKEIMTLAGVIKKPKVSFYEAKGVIEQLFADFGIQNVKYKKASKGGVGADIVIGAEKIGEIEMLDKDIVNFECNFETITKHASLKKIYKPLSKFPPMIEDMAFIISEDISTGEIMNAIKKQSPLIADVSLLDQYEDSRTFHIVYQHSEKNLTNEEVALLREKIANSLEKKFNITLKE